MIHPLIVRICHWLNAFAMVCMMMSGWAIYNASPLFGFHFPLWATLGGWLGGSIAWHFAAMWLLAANGLLYLAYGLISGHLRGRLLPLRPAEIRDDLVNALKLRLPHRAGVYNAVQRLLYLAVLVLGVVAVASGLSLWKPVQLWWLSGLFGGYDIARYVHFLAMTGIAGFVILHLALVVLVPRTLLPMVTGRAPHGTSHEVSS